MEVNMENNDVKLVTFLGYLWFSTSLVWTIFEIIDRSFFLGEENNWLIFVWIFGVSVIISLILYKYYPAFLSFFFYRKSDGEKYFNISNNDRLLYDKMLIIQNLNHVEDEAYLLEPLKISILNNQYEQAIKIGLYNSSTFLRLGKHYIRTINGLHTLYALHKWSEYDLKRQESYDFLYVLSFIKINDLGWSLYHINHTQEANLTAFIKDNKYLDCFDIFSNRESYRKRAKNNIVNTKDDLIEKKMFYKLICQALRHTISIDDYSEQLRSNLRSFEENIKQIPNSKDRKEMRANLLFLQADKIIKNESNNLHALEKSLRNVNNAEKLYNNIRDGDRKVKCYNMRGRIYLCMNELSHNDYDFYNQFLKGLIESENIARYDEVLKNIDSIIATSTNPYEIKKFAEKGLAVARLLRNEGSYIKYLKLIKPQHVLLIRHGESKKNISKTINGSGKLTEIGQSQAYETSSKISRYLKEHGFSNEEIRIYGYNNLQVKETIEIFENALMDAEINYTELLKPVNMGNLKEKEEANIISKEDYITLERWRNRKIPIKELLIEGMEKPEDFWQRAETFNNLIKNNEVSIVICTTSISILLTHFFLGNKYDTEKYKAIDVPLGGIIHFIKEKNEFKLYNKDTLTNISFFELDNLYNN